MSSTTKPAHTPTPWVSADDGAAPAPLIEDQARLLVEAIGTDEEWGCIGINDEDGFAEVVALAHPNNARFIVRAVNSHAELVAALEGMINNFYPRHNEQAAIIGENGLNPVIQNARAALARAMKGQS